MCPLFVKVVSEGGSGANVTTTNVGLSRVVKSVGMALSIWFLHFTVVHRPSYRPCHPRAAAADLDFLALI